MAWTKTAWSCRCTDDTDQDKVRIDWTWVDTVDTGIKKRGGFDFTLTGANTWTVEKAAIQTKVDNADGAES